jgi:hypothetical protein
MVEQKHILKTKEMSATKKLRIAELEGIALQKL